MLPAFSTVHSACTKSAELQKLRKAGKSPVISQLIRIYRVASKMNSRAMAHGENKHLNLKNKSNADELIFVTANIITDKIALVHPSTIL
jgi:hypothetical protein